LLRVSCPVRTLVGVLLALLGGAPVLAQPAAPPPPAE
jgi:hypothetical protein